MRKNQKKTKSDEFIAPWLWIDDRLSSTVRVPVEDGDIDIEKYIGFVYEIRCIKTDKWYIGKKLFTKAGYKTVKGKKKKIRKQSDWLTYCGSNQELLEDIKKHGQENLDKRIIYLCSTKGELSYMEAKQQFISDVLFNPERWYNSWIQCKIHRKHLKDINNIKSVG